MGVVIFDTLDTLKFVHSPDENCLPLRQACLRSSRNDCAPLTWSFKRLRY